MTELKHKSVLPGQTADREIASTRLLDAPRELVFRMFTEPEHITHWWGPVGFRTTTHEMDFRPGGVWRFTMHGPDGTDFPNKIVYLDIVRPERLSYKHTGEAGHEAVHFHSVVTFVDRGGKTELSMRATFDTAEERNFVAENYGAVEGMHQTIARLAEYLASMTE